MYTKSVFCTASHDCTTFVNFNSYIQHSWLCVAIATVTHTLYLPQNPGTISIYSNSLHNEQKALVAMLFTVPVQSINLTFDPHH